MELKDKLMKWWHFAAEKAGLAITREPAFAVLPVGSIIFILYVLITRGLQVPRQPNLIDCGIYTVYFFRAAIESPDWVVEMAKEHIAARGTERAWSTDVELAARWGNPPVAYLRTWLRYHLISLMD